VLLTDFQWSYLETLLKVVQVNSPGGRPPLDHRLILECILWKLALGLPWDYFPFSYPFLSEFSKPYPSHQTIYRRYRIWLKSGLFNQMLRFLVQDLEDRGGLDIFSALSDGSLRFVKRERGMVLVYDPSLQSTWQLTTALLLLSIFIKRGKSTKNLSLRTAAPAELIETSSTP
jgi:transposase